MRIGKLGITMKEGLPHLRWHSANTGMPEMENPPPPPPRPAPQAFAGPGGFYGVYSLSFNGEKNAGDAGPIRQYSLDHAGLRLRSWQLFLESEICQIVFKRYERWAIGEGLRLQAEPQTLVLKSEKITADITDFSKLVEARFRIYSNSRMADYAGMKSLHKIASTAKKNAIIGGDVLVVLRLVKGIVKVQLIDGAHLGTLSNSLSDQKAENGNVIRHGIEMDATGQHVAYHIRKGAYGSDSQRIPARGAKSGALMAFMVYGLEHRLDNVRGIPLISAVMETAKKMDRYKEATLASAEERAKMPYSIEHDMGSTGENPLSGLDGLRKASGFATPIVEDAFAKGEVAARAIAATTNNQVFNMPQGSQLKVLESKAEGQFESFFSANIELVCATVGIPPNVAMMHYKDSFSASRAALKDWEHALKVDRKDFAFQFYQNVYNFWLKAEVLAGKVDAIGYLEAVSKGNEMAVEAYQYARWEGTPVPHIDPLKEVMAQRAMLGKDSENVPLTTIEQATENLNAGEYSSNVEQYADEMAQAKKRGIEKVEKTPGRSTGGPTTEE